MLVSHLNSNLLYNPVCPAVHCIVIRVVSMIKNNIYKWIDFLLPLASKHYCYSWICSGRHLKTYTVGEQQKMGIQAQVGMQQYKPDMMVNKTKKKEGVWCLELELVSNCKAYLTRYLYIDRDYLDFEMYDRFSIL